MVATAMLLAACSSDNADVAATSTSVEPTTTTTPPDGRLKIGFLLPVTGPGAALGRSLLAGGQMAVEEINRAGGLLGSPVTVVTRDEGGSSAVASPSIDDLIDANVDVIVGPASSRVAFSVLGRAIQAGVAVCSPTNTAIGLSSYPDRDLYLRTIPSDSLQAVAIGELVERSGNTSIAVLAPDDDYGTAFRSALVANLQQRGLTVTGTYSYEAADGDLTSAARLALTDDTENVVLIGSGDGGAAMLSAVRSVDPELPVFVNDAMKSPSVVAALGEKAGELLTGVTGVAPSAEPDSREFVDAFALGQPLLSDDFAAYAYDCVNLLAIAASAAGSDDPRLLVQQLVGVSTSGNPCSTFEKCNRLLALDQNINLRGASGDLDLDDNGDVTSGDYQSFTFDETGSPVDGDAFFVP